MIADTDDCSTNFWPTSDTDDCSTNLELECEQALKEGILSYYAWRCYEHEIDSPVISWVPQVLTANGLILE